MGRTLSISAGQKDRKGNVQCLMKITIVLFPVTKSPNVVLVPCSSTTSHRLALKRSLSPGGVFGSKFSFSNFCLDFLSFLVSLTLGFDLFSLYLSSNSRKADQPDEEAVESDTKEGGASSGASSGTAVGV